ncbi:unnamed protein product [Urochloa humidicola]
MAGAGKGGGGADDRRSAEEERRVGGLLADLGPRSPQNPRPIHSFDPPQLAHYLSDFALRRPVVPSPRLHSTLLLPPRPRRPSAHFPYERDRRALQIPLSIRARIGRLISSALLLIHNCSY